MEYYKSDIENIYKTLESSSLGLKEENIEKKINRYGLNELPKKKKENIFKQVFNQINDPIIEITTVIQLN